MNKLHKGFTLIELMIAAAVMSILLALAAPSMTMFIEKARIRNATEFAYGKFMQARSEAIKQSKTVYVTILTGAAGAWKLSINDTGTCDLGASTDCTLTTTKADGTSSPVEYMFGSAEFQKINLVSNNFKDDQASFDGVRGIALNAGTATFEDPNGVQLAIRVSSLGRIMICNPSSSTGKISGYRDCP